MTENSESYIVIDTVSIMKVLPHRFPFLLVDRVLIPKEEVMKKAVGQKNVTINEWFFQGHFPDDPVMPGVLIVEAMSQTAACLAFQILAEEGRKVYFTSMDGVRFRKPVIPGDQLIMEVEIYKKRTKVIKFKGVAKVDGFVVTESEFMGAIM